MLLVEKLVDVAEILVAEGEVVDVGGVLGCDGLLLAIVEAVWVRDRHVKDEKVDGGIGQVGVANCEELAVVGGVLADVEGLV